MPGGLTINIKTFGYDKFQKQMKHLKLVERKAFRELLEKVAGTALEYARAHAPVRTGMYRKSIKTQLISNIRARLYGEGTTMNKKENASRGTRGHGYLAGLLEYGTVKMRAQPHLQAAVEHALKVHEKDVAAYIHGIFVRTFGEFGE